MGWILWGGFLGAIVLFVWNAVAWMVLHHHQGDFKPLPTPGPVEEGLKASGATAGMYQLPHFVGYEKGMGDPEFAKRYEVGPNALIVVSPPGPCMEPKTFLWGFLVNLAEAMGAALAVHYAKGVLAGLVEIVWFTAMLGLLVHAGPVLSQSVWLRFPWSHSIKTAADGVIGFALMGLVFHFTHS